MELNKTVLHQKHMEAGARLVDFAGWSMPIDYGSQIAEHHQVRGDAGIFDVSHMGIIDISGVDATAFLRYMLCNDVIRLDQSGKALYTPMLNHQGGVVDDLIVYRVDAGYRLVVNCATTTKDLAWLQQHAEKFLVNVSLVQGQAIMAVHGPNAIDKFCRLLPEDQVAVVKGLKNFRAAWVGDYYVARTGYTGELGIEVILPEAMAPTLWDALLEVGVKPIGLGARDTLRLEAGMNLYGQDMDETTSPLESNLESTISWEPAERDFVGRTVLMQQKSAALPELLGLLLLDKGILRHGQKVVTDKGEGVITSGGFSPTLGQSIALARIPAGSVECQVDIRGSLKQARIMKPNFVRHGKKVFDS